MQIDTQHSILHELNHQAMWQDIIKRQNNPKSHNLPGKY